MVLNSIFPIIIICIPSYIVLFPPLNPSYALLNPLSLRLNLLAISLFLFHRFLSNELTFSLHPHDNILYYEV